VDANNPYRPPISDAQVAPGFVDPGTRARMLANALLVYCAVAAASGGATVLYALSIMDGRSPTPDDVDPNTEESIQLLTMFAHAIVFLTTVVLYGRFAAGEPQRPGGVRPPLALARIDGVVVLRPDRESLEAVHGRARGLARDLRRLGS
jgi:hypothetical protein